MNLIGVALNELVDVVLIEWIGVALNEFNMWCTE